MDLLNFFEPLINQNLLQIRFSYSFLSCKASLVRVWPYYSLDLILEHFYSLKYLTKRPKLRLSTHGNQPKIAKICNFSSLNLLRGLLHIKPENLSSFPVFLFENPTYHSVGCQYSKLLNEGTFNSHSAHKTLQKNTPKIIQI